MHAVMNPKEANELSELSFTPPHKAMIQNRIPVNPAVLKFGCLSINKINKPKVKIEIIFLSFLTKFQCAKRFDASRIKKGLINSDGWRRKFPITNHLDEPFTVIPIIFVSNIKKTKK